MTQPEQAQLRQRLMLLSADLWVLCARLPAVDGSDEAFRAIMRELLALTDLVTPEKEAKGGPA